MVDPADSINPFPDLATAPPTNAPSVMSAMPPPAPGPMLPLLKPSWKRVSTRQWIRNFREHIKHYYTLPYNTLCNVMFFTTGYYPDMIHMESYQRYIAKYPVTTRKGSTGSGAHFPYGVPGAAETDMSSIVSTTDASMTSTVATTSVTDANDNRRKFSYDKRTEGMHTKKSLAMIEAIRKKSLVNKEEAEKAAAAVAAAAAPAVAAAPAAAAAAEKGKKGKKGDKAAAAEAPPAAAEAPPAEAAPAAEPKGKKGKKGKGGEEAPAAPADAAPEADAGSEGGGKKGKKGKKGKEEAAAPAEEAAPTDSEAGAEAAEPAAKGKGKKGKKK